MTADQVHFISGFWSFEKSPDIWDELTHENISFNSVLTPSEHDFSTISSVVFLWDDSDSLQFVSSAMMYKYLSFAHIYVYVSNTAALDFFYL